MRLYVRIQVTLFRFAISFMSKQIHIIWTVWVNACIIVWPAGHFLADSIPSNKSMLLQILVTIKAMPLYCVLPTFAEYVVEHDWTKCYPRVLDVGWPAYAFHIITYLTFIEFCIYWMHRGLHDIKPLYKYLHAKHHIYNKKTTLSPFAGKFLICFLNFCSHLGFILPFMLKDTCLKRFHVICDSCLICSSSVWICVKTQNTNQSQ